GHLLAVFEPRKVCDRSPRPAGALAGRGAPARHGAAVLVRGVRGPADRHRRRGGAALRPRLLRPLPRAPGHRLDAAAAARDLRRLLRRAERLSGPGEATRPAAPAAGRAGRVPAPGDENGGLRDRDLPGRRNPEGPPVRVRPDGADARLRVLLAGPRGRGHGAELEPGADLAGAHLGRPHGPPGGPLLQVPACSRNGFAACPCRGRGATRRAGRAVSSGLNRSRAMRVGKRILAGITLLLGVAGLLLSLAGGVGVWIVKGPVTERATHVFGRIDAALTVAEQG